MVDENEDEYDEDHADDEEHDFDGDVAPLDSEDFSMDDDVSDDIVFSNANTEDYIETNYEDAVKANPKRMNMLKKRARVIEGIVDEADLKRPENALKIWNKLSDETNTGVTRDYSIKDVYGENDILEHPTFGTGFVIQILSPTKIEVLFEDGLRRLAVNKG